MRSCLWGQVAVAAALLATFAPPARADALDDARKAVEGSDYLAARPALETALKEGSAGPEQLAEIYKLTGIVEAALGDTDASERAFAHWLALDPKGALPPGTSPKITRPFDAALVRATKLGPLEVKAQTKSAPPAVTLVVVNDPEKMIVGAKVYFATDGKPEEKLEADGKKKVTIELGTGTRIDLRLHAVDRYGNRVAELGTTDTPLVITSSGKETKLVADKPRQVPVHVEPARARPWYLTWWVWGTATIAVAGAGGYFAWQTRSDLQELDRLNANSLSHPWSDAQAVEASARRNLLVTNIAAGTAGALAVGTALLFLTRPSASESELRATVAPTRGGGALVLGGQF